MFFLIDPKQEVLSTAVVPPQQQSWFSRELKSMSVTKRTELGRLPDPVISKIVSYMDYPMSYDDAKKHREELMRERKYFVNDSNERLFERPFSLCEH